MNESGQLNLSRFEIYITELAKYDYERFENENELVKQLHKSHTSKSNASELDKDQLVNTTGFSLQIMETLKITAPNNINKDLSNNHKNESNSQLIDTFITNERKSPVLSSSSSPSFEMNRPNYRDADDDDVVRSSDSERSSETIDDDKKHLSKTTNPSDKTSNHDLTHRLTIEIEFQQHKHQYYANKMKTTLITNEQIHIYVQQYIEALQWILKYYYQGCQSWSWFYPQHYAPYLSDLKNFKHLQISFKKGMPFKPFEQLLGQ
jgi:5'-3' exonuclease